MFDEYPDFEEVCVIQDPTLLDVLQISPLIVPDMQSMCPACCKGKMFIFYASLVCTRCGTLVENCMEEK